MLVKHGDRLESRLTGDVQQCAIRGDQETPRRLDLGSDQQIGGGGMEVLAEELEAACRPESGTPHDRPGISKAPRMCADLGDKRLNGFQHGVRPSGKVVGMAPQARPHACGPRSVAGRKKPDVFGFGLPCPAGRQTIDPRREDAREKPAVPCGIARNEPGIHVGMGHSHGRRSGRETLYQRRGSMSSDLFRGNSPQCACRKAQAAGTIDALRSEECPWTPQKPYAA